MDSISHAEDDITHVYISILKVNKRLKENPSMMKHERKYFEDAAFLSVAVLDTDCHCSTSQLS